MHTIHQLDSEFSQQTLNTANQVTVQSKKHSSKLQLQTVHCINRGVNLTNYKEDYVMFHLQRI